NAARGLFGLGGRKARIRATVRKPIDAEPLIVRGEPPPAAHPAPERRARRSAAATERGAGPLADHARQVLQEIVDRIGVPATAEMGERDQQILLDLTGDSSGVLIGRRGQMLDALEYIVNRIVARDETGSARVVIDSQGYRERRRQSLEELARRMG